MIIRDYRFDPSAEDEIRRSRYGSDWPVVYILNNDKEAYIGETVDAARRLSQHLQNQERRRLKNAHIISDDDYNKSVVLDLESFLIKYMSSDEKYRLQNGNGGISNHNYYNRTVYEKQFRKVWNALFRKNLVQHSLTEIENSDLFKYSPYKALTPDQKDALYEILRILHDDRQAGEKSTILVEGGAGTGKTVLAIYLMKLLSEFGTMDEELGDNEEEFDTARMVREIGELRFAFVVPMQSLRKTVKKVFKTVKGLSVKMVLSPLEVGKNYPKDYFDLLIVDEAHRLRQRKALSQYPAFDKNNERLGFGNEGTELDWILKCSKHQLLFYDPLQSVKPSDIDREQFQTKVQSQKLTRTMLTSQLRCKGGSDYVRYIRQMLSDEPPRERRTFGEYDIRLFDDVQEMAEAIRERDAECGLSRITAGYSWEWVTKGKKKIDPKVDYDIEINGHRFIWNSVDKDWINSKNAINEVGCIHTVQGYDLNYCGVIFGQEIWYDRRTGRIEVDMKRYKDRPGKTALSDPDALRNYIFNIYLTMMTRGICGTYVYVCDDVLREYMRSYL
ncbi:MAG: DUF2075 domain-containing protein [Mogibacterium sp.]|nr:DUF2075 domain-containing protein [Mogibacterium sp.]